MSKYVTSIVFKTNANDAISAADIVSNLGDLVQDKKITLNPVKNLLSKGYKYKNISGHIEFDDQIMILLEDVERNVGSMISGDIRPIVGEQTETNFSDVYTAFWVGDMIKKIRNRQDISEHLGALEEYNEIIKQLQSPVEEKTDTQTKSI